MTTNDETMARIEAALDEFQDASERVYEAQPDPGFGDPVQRQREARAACLALIREALPKPTHMRHLRFDILSAHDAGERRHAQEVMRELGIEYQFAAPQSLGDCWQFWNCVGGPDPLPPFLTEFEADPMKHIGYGLSEEMALAIAAAGGGRPTIPVTYASDLAEWRAKSADDPGNIAVAVEFDGSQTVPGMAFVVTEHDGTVTRFVPEPKPDAEHEAKVEAWRETIAACRMEGLRTETGFSVYGMPYVVIDEALRLMRARPATCKDGLQVEAAERDYATARDAFDAECASHRATMEAAGELLRAAKEAWPWVYGHPKQSDELWQAIAKAERAGIKP